jgi:Ca2+-binding RTX toxin-like protein
LDGGMGSDYLVGGMGNDTYLFNLGDGQDTIFDYDETTGNSDTIQFGSGIVSSDVTFTRREADLILGIQGTSDQVTIPNWAYGDACHIEQVLFADGTLWDTAYLQMQFATAAIIGTTGNDYLAGNVENNTLDGGAGNDYLLGDTGNDTYLFNLGSGQDTIADYDETTGNLDTVKFGTGIVASDVTFTRNGTDLVLSIAGTMDQVTIQNWGYTDYYHIERVQFADGTTWDMNYLQTHIPEPVVLGTTTDDLLTLWAGDRATLQGDDGNDNLTVIDGDNTLEGGNGDDCLQGGMGNDTFNGGTGNDISYDGAGNDTYLFNLGDGQDTIYDMGSVSGNLDTIQFGTGIAASDLTFTRSGMNLVLGINGTTDQLTIQNWGNGSDYRIERIVFADGTAQDTAQIQALIDAPPIV